MAWLYKGFWSQYLLAALGARRMLGVRRFCANCDTQAMMTVEPGRGRGLARSNVQRCPGRALPGRLGQYRSGMAGERVAVSMGGAKGATMAAGYAGSETLHQIACGSRCHWCAAPLLAFIAADVVNVSLLRVAG